MQLVSQQPNLNKKKMSIESTSFTPAQRIKPFNGEVVYCSTVIITDCLDAMVEDAIEKTVAMDNSPSVVFFEGVMSMVFHKANKERYAADLLQPDIRAIYKAFKVHLNTINNRYDYAYVNAINEFLTTTINDIMRPFKNNLNVFENFSTDFNDMLTVMRNKDSIETEDKLIGYVNEILVKTNLNQQISDSFEEEEAAEAQKNGETHTPLKRATIDVPVNIICLNYISTEIGDADNLKHLLQNIEQLAASVNHGFHAAYVCTIDKVIYKIVVGGGNIFVDLVRG